MRATAPRRRRAVGVLLLLLLMGMFLALNRAPKLDTVRGDLDEAVAPVAAQTATIQRAGAAAEGRAGAGLSLLCVQGYCAQGAPGQSLLDRWWEFSSTYLELVTLGMVFAFLVAGLTEVFLFPRDGGAGFADRRGWRGSARGLAAGAPMTLCSACIVPVANAIRRRGGSAESVVAAVQGSATLNLPALIMLFVVFTPMMAGARVGLSLVGALALGPLVAIAAGQARSAPLIRLPAEPLAGDDSWRAILRAGARDWPRASLGYFIRLGPIMVVAALLSGLVIQWVDVDAVQTWLGNNVTGVLIAAAVGVLINVPLLFEIPLVALLLVLGMGEAPAAVLLFTAAAAGPITFWGLVRVLPRRAVVTYGASTWALGVVGGLVVLGLGLLASGGDFGVRDDALRTAGAAPATTEIAPAPVDGG